jgi:ribosomal protein S18 acetylase RimI-like enzyme
LVELLGILFGQERDFAPDPVKQAQALAQILSRTEARVWVAREGDEVVGMVNAQAVISTAEGGPALWLEDFVVRPAFRKRGIGTQLLQHVICEAKARGYRRITLLADGDNYRAQALYLRHGFQPSAMRLLRLML